MPEEDTSLESKFVIVVSRVGFSTLPLLWAVRKGWCYLRSGLVIGTDIVLIRKEAKKTQIQQICKLNLLFLAVVKSDKKRSGM